MELCRGQYPRTGVARQHGPRGPGTPALWGGRGLRLNVTVPALSAASAGLTARSRTRAVGPRHARGFMEPETERPGLVALQGVRIRRLLGDTQRRVLRREVPAASRPVPTSSPASPRLSRPRGLRTGAWLVAADGGAVRRAAGRRRAAADRGERTGSRRSCLAPPGHARARARAAALARLVSANRCVRECGGREHKLDDTLTNHLQNLYSPLRSIQQIVEAPDRWRKCRRWSKPVPRRVPGR